MKRAPGVWVASACAAVLIALCVGEGVAVSPAQLDEAAAVEEGAFHPEAEEAAFMSDVLLETGVLWQEGADGQHGSLVEVGQEEWAGAEEVDADVLVEVESQAGVGAGVDVDAEKVHGYCEICIRQLQMYQRGLPDLCAGLTDTFFITVRPPPPHTLVAARLKL
jgi:hypothetical protein